MLFPAKGSAGHRLVALKVEQGFDLPTRGDLAFYAFVGHFNFSSSLLGFVNRPGLQAD